MKTLKLVGLTILLLSLGCSKNNDDDSENQQQSNLELLTSGKWYFQSKTPGSYTACEKKGYIQFMNDGMFTINVFDESSGTCASLGAVSANYTLTNEVMLTLTLGSETQSAVINNISESQLNITNTTQDETIVFDKTEG